MSPELQSPLFAAAREAFTLTQNVAFEPNTPAERQACAEQAAKLRSLKAWNTRVGGRLGFYSREANANPNMDEPSILKSIGYEIGTLARVKGFKSLEPVWQVLGLVEGDPALEVVKLKESGSAILQEAQEIQDKAEKEVRVMREQVASAERKVAEMESLIEAAQARAAEAVALKDAQIKGLEHTVKEQETGIAKLRAELQTAQTKVHTAPAPVAPPVVKVDSDELTRLRALVAEQASNLAELASKVERYSNAVDACFDAEMKLRYIFIAENQHKLGKPGTDPKLGMFLEDALYFIRHSLDGRTCET